MSQQKTRYNWISQPPSGWRFHLLVAFLTIVPITFEMALRTTLAEQIPAARYDMFWGVTPVTTMMFLLWGQRSFWGVLVGTFIGFLPWESVSLAAMDALDGAVQVSLGIWLLRKFWPQSMPLQPSVRFFAILIGIGSMLPVTVTSLPTVYIYCQDNGIANYWNKYIEWCISELSGVLILLPLLLLIVYPSFRRTLVRPLELGVYILTGIALMIGSVLIGLNGGSDEIVSMEGWLLIGTIGFIMIVRNGVGGVIISNAMMTLALIGVQLYLGWVGDTWITDRMLNEFNIYSCHLTGLMLILAAGFHDHKMLNNASRGMAARILNVQVSERRKLAADLHDSVSQDFAAALMYLRTGSPGTPQADGDDSIELAEKALVKGLQELRQVTVGLRPEMFERNAFADVIESYCQSIETRYSRDVLFVNEIGATMPRLSLEKREHIFRIIQESVSNAINHGQAGTVTVSISSNSKRRYFQLFVEDDGCGFDQTLALDMSDRPHFGLKLMQERALIIDGSFRIWSRVGRGTAIEVRVPWDSEEEAMCEHTTLLMQEKKELAWKS